MYPGKPAQFYRSKSRLWLTIACVNLLIAFGASEALGNTTNVPTTNLSRVFGSREFKQIPAPNVMQSIRRAVQQQFGVSKITLVNATEQNWPDGCLGLPRDQEVCTTVIVPGWRVEVSDNLQTWVYRSDRTGKTLRLENLDHSLLSQSVARKLIQQVARETNTLPTKLRITAVKPQVFGGCLGIYRPNQPCTKIAIPGWQAIVTSPNQTLVYHLNQNATRIVQNKTASGAKRTIRVSFEALGKTSPIAANEIFRSSTSGDFTGRMTSSVLTEDGKITQYQSSPTARFAPVVIKTLSINQLNAFKAALENLQFPNLNGLSYLTTAALADYPTTTYYSQSTAIQFIDLEKKSLPRSLQQVITSWEFLVNPAK
jgi:hypothetical protein